MTTDNALTKVNKARAGLVLSQPFFASLLLRLKTVEDSTCETAWVDGTTLGFNPQWIDSLTMDQTKGVLCHEVMHCAMSHASRRGTRDHGQWNAAADYAINGVLLDSNMVLPEGILYNPTWAGKAAEEVYGLLPQPKPSDGQDGSQQSEGDSRTDPGACGEVRDSKGQDGQSAASQSELAQAEETWKVALGQAMQQAKAQGTMPAGLARMVEDILAPAVNWREVLRRFVDQSAKSDYSWSRPNRRHIAEGLYLPSLHSDELPPIVVAVDTSGSIDGQILAQFAGEISSIMEDYQTTVRVIYCDSDVNAEETFTSQDAPIILHAHGGGGTDFGPVFDLVDAAEESPACLVYLTDMWGRFPQAAPGYPVLWASTDGEHAPFGELVKLKA